MVGHDGTLKGGLALAQLKVWIVVYSQLKALMQYIFLNTINILMGICQISLLQIRVHISSALNKNTFYVDVA